jgi:hypothetical protein
VRREHMLGGVEEQKPLDERQVQVGALRHLRRARHAAARKGERRAGPSRVGLQGAGRKAALPARLGFRHSLRQSGRMH